MVGRGSAADDLARGLKTIAELCALKGLGSGAEIREGNVILLLQYQ